MCCGRKKHKDVKLGCCVEFLSGLNQIMNWVFFVAGLFIVGAGIYVMVVVGVVSDLVEDSLPIGLIVCGAAVSVVAFIGCCAARKNNKFWLTIYFTVLCAIIMAQIGITIALYIQRDHLDSNLEIAWNDHTSMSERKPIEKHFKCCGWNNVTYPQCNYNYTEACGPIIYDNISDNLLWLAIAAMVLIGIEFLGMMVACWQCCQIRAAHRHHDNKAYISSAREHRPEYKTSSKFSKDSHKHDSHNKHAERERLLSGNPYEASEVSRFPPINPSQPSSAFVAPSSGKASDWAF